jgi:hypothetical protein
MHKKHSLRALNIKITITYPRILSLLISRQISVSIW